jgi:hypothetical protein
MKKPVKTSARQNSWPAASGSSSAHASEPRIGPARPTRASATALPPSEREATAAPRNGMNTMPDGVMPSRLSWM